MVRTCIVAFSALVFSASMAIAEVSEATLTAGGENSSGPDIIFDDSSGTKKFKLPNITVSGSAHVFVKPDFASLSLGVVTEKPTAAEAVSENAKAATAAIAMLKSAGTDPADIKTTGLSLSPVRVEETDPKKHQITKSMLTGYRARNTINIRVKDVDKAGTIFLRAVESGANHYDGLKFGVSDQAKHMDGVRMQAVAEAMRRATLYARGAKMKLGRLLALEPETDAEDLPVRRSGYVSNSPSIDIEPGLEKISAKVSATWELVPE